MEGDNSELEIDSELVMSFYDQYQVDDLACKVYCGVEPIKSEAGGGVTLSTSVIELKAPAAAPAPDVSMMCPASPVTTVGPPGSSTAWNLPDLLVGLDGIQTRCSSDTDSPPLSSQNLLTSSIPCISIPSLDITDNHVTNTNNQFYSFDNYRGPTQTDSLLEGLGILSPPPVSSVKTEMVTCSSPQPHYSLVDTRGEGEYQHQPGRHVLYQPVISVESPISMDLSQLVNQHNIPAQFELSLSPKCEPVNTPSIPISSFSLSNITNIASVSIANIDLLSKSAPLSLDLIAQHCTLLPPELVSLPPCPLNSLDTNTTYIAQDQDIVNNNINADIDTVLQPVNIKEVSVSQIQSKLTLFNFLLKTGNFICSTTEFVNVDKHH